MEPKRTKWDFIYRIDPIAEALTAYHIIEFENGIIMERIPWPEEKFMLPKSKQVPWMIGLENVVWVN